MTFSSQLGGRSIFYEPDTNDHGLQYNPYKSIVVPRPIGWVSTLGPTGIVKIAPFSQFNNIGYDPPYVMFAAAQKPDGTPKDSTANAMRSGEFVCSMATYELREAVNVTGQFVDADVDEMAMAGLTPAPSRLIAPPRVAESPVHLECRFHATMVLPGHHVEANHDVVVGRVIGVHIEDDALTDDGRIDIARLRPLARLGYYDYAAIDSVFEMMPEGPNSRAFTGEASGAAK